MRFHLRLGSILLGIGVVVTGFAQNDAYTQALQAFRENSRSDESLRSIIEARQSTTAEDELSARLVVLRDVADIVAEEEHWRDALGYSRTAMEISRRLEDAEMILTDGLRTARFAFLAGARGEAAILSRELATMAEQLDRPNDLEDAWMVLAKVHQVSGSRDKANAYFEKILALPSRDPFTVLQQQAWGYHGPKYQPFLRDRWTQALLHAEADGDIDRQLTAHQKLAEVASFTDDQAAAKIHLERIELLREYSGETRSAIEWHTLAQFQLRENQTTEAKQSLERGIEQASADEDSDSRIVLRAELAKLLAETDPVAAYGTLESAYNERVAIGRNQQFIPETAISIEQTTEELDALSELAAVRNALRDAKLANTQARNRQIAATAIALTLLATVLMLAFLLKRRAAQTATLQAENAQLEALRYQLNPHFLFNSLANLNGLILTSPDRARQTIRRLSDFCRLALTRQESPLLSVKDEAARLQAYLDVALAAEEADLQANLIVAPEAEVQTLPPLLIQPLIENALKYAEPDSDDQRVVTAHISAPAPKTLRIEVSNTGPWERRAPARPSTGVGLPNLRERLTRYYPHRHELTFTKTPTQVTATLTLRASTK